MHNLGYGFFDMFASITQVQSHYSLYSFWMRLKWRKITQYLFLFGNFNDNRGRPTLRIVMSQVANLKLLGFTWKKMATLLGVSTSFWSPYFCNHLFCGRRCCKTSICISCCREADDSPAPTLWSSLLSSPSLHLLYWGTVFLTLVMVAGFHPLVLLLCLSNL